MKDNFLTDIKKLLKEKEVPRDLSEAEDLLKKHQDLRDEISAAKERSISVHSNANYLSLVCIEECFSLELLSN